MSGASDTRPGAGRRRSRTVLLIAVVNGVCTVLAFTFASAAVARLVGVTGLSVALVVTIYQELMAQRDQRRPAEGRADE